jgi:Putative peptidoglycan binding domain
MRARRLVVAAALVVAAGAVVADRLGAQGRAQSPPAKAAAATTVTRRDLVVTDTESGTLSYASPRIVYDRLGGTITWLPSVGQVIEPGRTLYQVDGQRVVLLDGAFPAYRTLGSGAGDGPDVLQLNRDLVELGFGDGQITVDDAWQAGTTAAVERWQASLGEVETGQVTLGQIVFLPGAQRVSEVDATLGSAGSPAAAILHTTSTRPVVTVELDASRQGEAVAGAPVTVQMPGGTSMQGKITHVSAVAKTSTGSSSPAATVPVIIALEGRRRSSGLDQATVSVSFQQQRARDVLSVPVTALVATQGARYAVQEADAPHALIRVGTGIFAAGYVQIAGAGVRPGLRVTDSQG